jgi:hypothetical protein
MRIWASSVPAAVRKQALHFRLAAGRVSLGEAEHVRSDSPFTLRADSPNRAIIWASVTGQNQRKRLSMAAINSTPRATVASKWGTRAGKTLELALPSLGSGDGIGKWYERAESPRSVHGAGFGGWHAAAKGNDLLSQYLVSVRSGRSPAKWRHK